MSGPKTSEPPAPAGPEAILSGRNVVLVVTGGVAAYKAAALASLLAKSGATVRTAMTEAATRFVAPLTFEALTGQRAQSSLWDRSAPEIGHVAWSDWADLLVVAPATANFMAQAAAGEAGGFALATLLAAPGKALFAPAMNPRMYANPLTQRNVSALRGAGHLVMGPGVGRMACGDLGEGRMPEPQAILFHAARALSPPLLRGRELLVTGGSTLEPWDSIRFLANRSSGLMGVELAQAAWLMGARVTLLLGPLSVAPRVEDPDLTVLRAGGTESLLEAVRGHIPGKDALLMAAAPADFRPEATHAGKIRKSQGPGSIPLARNPDILLELARAGIRAVVMVGFSADDGEALLGRSREKIREKGLDFIVANPASGEGSSFASGDTSFQLLGRDGGVVLSGQGSKFAAAWAILSKIFEAGTR